MTTRSAPLISVIIPTHDRPEQLERCLAALARQTCGTSVFEVVVVDDGGRRRPGPVVAAKTAALRLRLLTQPNRGPAAARNLGARHARGRLLAFIDDDCWPAADWLTVLGEHFARIPGALLGGRTVNALPHNPFAATSQLIYEMACRYYNGGAGNTPLFSSNNLAVDRAVFTGVGGFDDSLRTSEDRELSDRLVFRGHRVVSVPEAIVYHAHDLRFRTFCRQHFEYGRGSFQYHRVRAARGSGTAAGAVGFHVDPRNWLLYPSKHPVANQSPAVLAALLLLWQLSNTAGFLREALRWRRVGRAATHGDGGRPNALGDRR
jgi:glycosyltransferase involved in cell wall biosynthesis